MLPQAALKDTGEYSSLETPTRNVAARSSYLRWM